LNSNLILNIDYIGVYIRPSGKDKKDFEILMADSARFKDEVTSELTEAKASFFREGDNLEIIVEGRFQERPITLSTKHVRSDIYINKKHCSKIIKWLEEAFDPKLLDELSSAPDPRIYRRGYKRIPLEDAPSITIYTLFSNFITPRWEIETQNSRVFVDSETDKELERVQVHLGIIYNKYDLIDGSHTEIGKNYSIKGKIVFDKKSVDLLYSYLKKNGA